MTTCRVLLPHPAEPRILMMQSHGTWHLPEWKDATERLWQVTDHVNRAVAARFGLDTTVLRCARNDINPVTGDAVRVYELENHSALHDMPASAAWIGADDVAKLPDDPEVREVIVDWFVRANAGAPPRGAPWMYKGWYVQALAWSIAELRKHGAVAQAAPEQLRAWERSFLMRISTDRGDYYFKAAPRIFGHEPALMEWLASCFPERVAEVVAADTGRHWLLMKAVAGETTPLEEVRNQALWEDAVRRLAEIQIESTKSAHQLARAGVPDRSLSMLARRIPRLCADHTAMLLGARCGLSRSEIDRVASLGPALLALTEELASFHIPDAIEHGDLWSANILVTPRGPAFLDWSDSSMSHPFFSLFHLMRDAASLLPASSGESRRRLRDAYLEPWSGYASMDRLVRAFEIARILSPIHLAAIAYAELLPSAGFDWEIACTVPENLRLAIDLLTAGT